MESLGILDKDSVVLGNEDEEILGEFDKSVCFVEGRYRVNLPWKPGMREALQYNKTVARKRFEGFFVGLNVITSCSGSIRILIDDYVREGFVECTSCDSLSDSQGIYLPHHAVIRSDKTASRIRIVFDASAHEDGHSSLNQGLYTGPNLHPNILELLLCFLKSPVAFTADTDSLNNEPYVLNFTRVLFGLRPSPYLLAATLKHHFKKYKEKYPHTFELLNSSIYVDDLICGQNNVPDALRTTLEYLQIFSDAGMLYCANSEDLWTLGVDWDSELPPKLRHKWQQWSSEAEGLTEIKISRFYLGDIDQEISKCELHCFSDSSRTAYGPILYLRFFVTCNNEIETSFICSKSRVAPLKSLTLPRLKLTAALLSARLAKQWGHCPGKDNPADLLSRGKSAVKLAQNELWWHDPPCLKLIPDHWPNRHRDNLDSELCSEKLEHRSSEHVAVTQQRESLVDINRFSSLKKLLKDSEFQNFVADKSIHWKFIVERAPWWGGFYKRLVKTIKDPLRKILDRVRLRTFEELSTIPSEVEVIVNHQPLTYVENGTGEPESLTPAHFLELGYGAFKYPIHFIELIDATTSKESYKKRKTYRTLYLSDEAHFWLKGYVNKQNCRIWSEANPQVYVETPLHPEKLTVWCALWAGGILLQKR
ncbi:integrase catalytic domain-containing protein [Trichonephila clavipes]|nr:integrase catalytic domain-containing protein [Trichonephila clavipes]